MLSVVAGGNEDRVAKPPKEDQERIERLIAALASQPEWQMQTHSVGRTPWGGASSPDKKRVVEAADALSKEGPAAFLQLAEHSDDKRFSFTLLGPNGNAEWSVTAVCYLIVRHNVDIWEDYIELAGSPRGVRYPVIPADTLKQWMREREGRTLKHLQIEVCERALVWLAAVKGKTFRLHGNEDIEPRRLKSIENVESVIKRLKAGEVVARNRSFFKSNFPRQGQ